MCLVHDNAEVRIGDHHKISLNYLNTKDAEEKAFYEQVKPVATHIGTAFWDLYQEFEKRETKESMIAKDADYLETAFQAKEYKDIGHKACQNWLDNVKSALVTKSAKKIFACMLKTEFTDWWQDLK